MGDPCQDVISMKPGYKMDPNAEIAEIEKKLQKLQGQVTYTINCNQARWEKIQEKFAAVYLLLNKNTETDRRTFESLKSLRRELDAIRNEEVTRIEAIKKDAENHAKRTEGIEKKASKIETKGAKLNGTIMIAIFILFLLYIKKDIEAGQVVDLILSVLAASGVTIYGIHNNSNE